jgi:hypothetical protein
LCTIWRKAHAEQNDLIVSSISSRLEYIQSVLQQTQLASATQTSSPDLEKLSLQSSQLVLSLDGHFYIRTSLNPEANCAATCGCHCHKVSTVQTPQWASALIGALFFGYSGIPVLNHQSCNERMCNREDRCLIMLRYYFPPWLWNRMVWVRARWRPLDGHLLSL